MAQLNTAFPFTSRDNMLRKGGQSDCLHREILDCMNIFESWGQIQSIQNNDQKCHFSKWAQFYACFKAKTIEYLTFCTKYIVCLLPRIFLMNLKVCNWVRGTFKHFLAHEVIKVWFQVQIFTLGKIE